MPFNKKVTVIQISPETRDKLKALGKKGETYEDVILKLLENRRGK